MDAKLFEKKSLSRDATKQKIAGDSHEGGVGTAKKVKFSLKSSKTGMNFVKGNDEKEVGNVNASSTASTLNLLKFHNDRNNKKRKSDDHTDVKNHQTATCNPTMIAMRRTKKLDDGSSEKNGETYVKHGEKHNWNPEPVKSMDFSLLMVSRMRKVQEQQKSPYIVLG